MVVEGFPVCGDGDAGAAEGGEFDGAVGEGGGEGVSVGGFPPDVCAGWGEDFEVHWTVSGVRVAGWPVHVFGGHVGCLKGCG